MVDPCFIHCHIFMQKLLFVVLKQLQTTLWIVDTLFYSTLSKCITHFEHSFLIDKYSCQMVNTLPSDIFNSSAISPNFNLQSAKISLQQLVVKLATVVEGDPKAPFSIATTPRCWGGCYSFPWSVPLYFGPYLIMLSIKQGSIKYHFLSLWYDLTWDWTQVSWASGEHSARPMSGIQ